MTAQQLRWFGVPEKEAVEIGFQEFGDCPHENIQKVERMCQATYWFCLDCYDTIEKAR